MSKVTDIRTAISTALEEYNAEKTPYSYLFPSFTIQYLTKFVPREENISELQAQLLQHKWNKNKETATDKCVLKVLLATSLNNAPLDISPFLNSLKILEENELLPNPVVAQANFNAITQGGGQYAGNIASALVRLKEAQLLAPDVTLQQAQENFNAITQGRGQYATDIAEALGLLKNAQLMAPDVTLQQAQANRDAITQGGGQYASNIGAALVRLKYAQLLAPYVTPVQAQGNFNVITQGGGQYARNIAEALVKLKNAQLLAPHATPVQAQANCDAITQGGGQYAGNIGAALVHLKDAQLLAPDVTPVQAQGNFNVITQGGGQYARNIAEALVKLKNAQLLAPHATPVQAQANCDAITQGGGQYATDIAYALVQLKEAQLLTPPDQAQVNFDKLSKVVKNAWENNHGINIFLMILNKENLTQERYNLFTRDTDAPLSVKNLHDFLITLNLDPLEEDIAPEDIDIQEIIEQILHFYEYVYTYLRKENETLDAVFKRASEYLIQIYKNVTTVSMPNIMFYKLFEKLKKIPSNSLDNTAPNSKPNIQYEQSVQAIEAIVEILANNHEEGGTFSISAVETVRNIYLENINSNSPTIQKGISAVSAAAAAAEKESKPPELRTNERMVILLGMCLNRSLSSFLFACAALHALDEHPPKLAIFNSEMSHFRKKPDPGMDPKRAHPPEPQISNDGKIVLA